MVINSSFTSEEQKNLPVCPYAKHVAFVRLKIKGTIGCTVSEYTYRDMKWTQKN